MNNILKVSFGKNTKIESKPLYQYDYGQKIKFIDLNLPSAYEVHFSNYEHGSSTTMVATSNEINIPDVYFTSGKEIYVWIYLHTGLSDGETRYQITIPIIQRATISNEQPTQQEQSAINQAIAALNSATSQISSNLSDANLAVRDASAARDGAHAYMLTTKGYKEQIENAIGNNYIVLGETRLTENQLKKLLLLIEED